MLKNWQIKVLEGLVGWDEFSLTRSDVCLKRKEQLLTMARRGEKKPSGETSLGRMLFNYTEASNSCYDQEFDKQIRELAPHWFITPSDICRKTKTQLLAMARNGEPKPSHKTSLGRVLLTYTAVNNKGYDPEFDKQIRDFAPQWFIDTVAENKKQLLEIAGKGEPKPSHKISLGRVLFNYTAVNNKGYDPEFDKQIRELAPQWFVITVVENKKQLLEMARKGEPRPGCVKHPLGSALHCYTCKGSSYDPEFDKQIRELAPQWFINTAVENKKQLLEMARKGEPRPARSDRLGIILVSYTCRGNTHSTNYDPKFDKQIRELAPQWFVTRFTICRKTKEQLLAMAKKGEQKPFWKSPLWRALARYTGKSNVSYDPDFTEQIKKIAPHWLTERLQFRRKKSREKKEQLLMMARKGAARPARNHYLGIALSIYTCDSNDTYDHEFDKQIRKIVPHWFISTMPKNKKQLLAMAKRGEPRPMWGNPLRKAFYKYTGEVAGFYDPKFTEQLREIAPHWFITRSDICREKKQQLLTMAMQGESKPSGEHPLASPLRVYTSSGHAGYDAEFDEQIRPLAPSWFITQYDLVTDKKKQLLEMAKNGESKPMTQHPLGHTLYNYIHRSTKCYDPAFELEIRKLAPHWFLNNVEKMAN